MERRRVAVMLAGVALVGGAVVALRLAGGTAHVSTTPPAPPPPTTVRPFTAEGVLAPTAGPPPASPGRVRTTAGPLRLQLRWGSALPGGHDPNGAVGYDVRWGVGTAFDHDKLVAEPYAELDGLRPGQEIRVEVETVDDFGQRSAPSFTSGQAQRELRPPEDNAFVDHFDGPIVPDPTRWQFSAEDNCADGERGTGDDAGHEVILIQCGQTVTLTARTPLRLRPATAAPGGELGRFTIDTDAPGESGALDVDLVPGPVLTIDGRTNEPLTAPTPGTAPVDAALPPGTIRVAIAATQDAAGVPEDHVRVSTGPGTPHVAPLTRVAAPIPAPETGIAHRWDVVLRTDGVQVFRDGVYVGGGNAVPGWSTATPLVEFGGPSLGQQREDLNLIGFGGAATTTPPLVPAPSPQLGGFPVVAPNAATSMVTSTDTGPGSALLRASILATPSTPTGSVTLHGRAPRFGLKLGDTTYAANPAVPGTQLVSGVRYPVVARIPASALRGQRGVPVDLVVAAPTDYPAQLEVQAATLDAVPGGHLDSGIDQSSAGTDQGPQLAGVDVQVLDASGRPVPGGGQTLPRGRAVLAVTMDAVGTQRSTGEIAGLAGFEVWLDDKELVAVPTARNGPGLAGTWDIAFDTIGATAGPHTIDVKSYSSRRGVPFGEAIATFQLGR
jgi:hypothetical protein